MQNVPTTRIIYNYNVGEVTQFLCRLDEFTELPLAATLRPDNRTCPGIEDYLPIYYPTVETGKLAVCLKVVFGNINASRLIEWMEIQKILGVDKIVLLWMEGINKDAANVFRHYSDQGFVYMYSYENRVMKKRFMWPAYSTEAQAALSHCWLAMKGYTYASMMDFDEIIIPSKRDTIKDSIQRMLAIMPDVGHFTFYQKLFLVDNKRVSRVADSTFLGEHRYRFGISLERCKTIYINNRTKIFRSSHTVYTKPGFKMYRVPEEEATFHHYRECPPYLTINCENDTLYYDDEILSYLPRLKGSLQSLMREKRELFWRKYL